MRIGSDRRTPAVDPPFEVLAPAGQTMPFVFASPHSGRVYPKAFLQATRLDGTAIRRSEDSFVDEIFAAAWFRFPPGDIEVARTRMRELLEWRVEKQPLQLPNAGSVFRNPPGDHAARLIEAAGLKGTRIGGAQVSEKHSNFIVNPEGSASASAIEMLIGRVQAEVREKFGISLQREVRIVGVAGQGGEGS